MVQKILIGEGSADLQHKYLLTIFKRRFNLNCFCPSFEVELTVADDDFDVTSIGSDNCSSMTLLAHLVARRGH